MDIKIMAVGAFFSPEGIVADTPKKSQYADYRVERSENTYNLFVTSSLKPAGVSVRIPLEIGAGDTVFMNGFQSATESRERSITEKISGFDMVSEYARRLYAEKIGGDYSIVKYKNKPGVTHGFSYCYFRNGDNVKLFASLDESTGYTVFKYDAWTATLKISKDIEGIESFDNYKAVSLFFAEGSEDYVFDKWFEALGKSEKFPAETLVGYTTKKLREINEDVVTVKLHSIKTCFPVKPNIFIIDGKYCGGGDWLDYNKEKFPSGMRATSDKIKADGLMSGLCLSPFTVEEASAVFVNHKDWLVRGKDGSFFKTKKDLYVLDSEKAEVREYVREVLHTVLYMWGFDLVKLDNLFVAGLHPSKNKSRGEKMCSAMAFLRECCGGKLLYADHTPLMPAFNLADYCAISCDAVSDNIPSTNVVFRESASVSNAAADIVFRRHLNKRAFLNVPSPVSLDDKEHLFDSKLNSTEQNVLTNLEGLFSSVIMTSDSTAMYDQKKKNRFKKMCSLAKNAENVSVKKSVNGFIVSYKYEGKTYLVKFK